MAAVAATTLGADMRRLRARGTAAVAKATANRLRTRPRLAHSRRTMLNARLDARAMLTDRVAPVHHAPLLQRRPRLLPHTMLLHESGPALLALEARPIVLRLRTMMLLHLHAMTPLPDGPALLHPSGAVQLPLLLETTGPPPLPLLVT